MENKIRQMEKIFSKSCFKFLPFVLFAGIGEVHAASFALFDIMDTLTSLQQILSQVGPLLSTVLFIIAGIFYAVGQLLPPDKRANFHTTSINIIIGAVMVAVLSVASSGLALASTHLLVNISTNAIK